MKNEKKSVRKKKKIAGQGREGIGEGGGEGAGLFDFIIHNPQQYMYDAEVRRLLIHTNFKTYSFCGGERLKTKHSGRLLLSA